ncbi:MAG: hypothetical protein ACLPN1_05945 [Dissulfurispiraceae bacterium]
MKKVIIRTIERCKRPTDLSSDQHAGKENSTHVKGYIVELSYSTAGVALKRIRFYTNQQDQVLISPKLASDLVRNIDLALSNGTFKPSDFRKKPDWSLRTCWEKYKTYKFFRGNPNTMRTLNAAERHIFSYFGNEKCVTTLDQADLDRFWVHLIATQKLFTAIKT